MKFGKLADIENVDFRLPPDAPSNASILAGNPHQTRPTHLYLGCTGWSMKEWVGSVYPKGAKTKDFLRHYSHQFNTIELNTTHYRIPDATTIQRWYQESAEDFRFCPKVPQSISHSKQLGLGTDLIPTFCHSVAGLEEKLGCCFIQLPPYFKTDQIPLLEKFLKAFSSDIPLAVELRHESWFETEEVIVGWLQMLNGFGVSAVITDVAGRRDVLHMGISSSIAMIRFVGNGLHPSDYRRADEWVQRLKSWSGPGLHEVYLFPHEPDNILAPQMATYFHQQIVRHLPEAAIRGPKLIEENNEGELMMLF
jgi:uncharacterized protein YecE (DUF72 family)